MPSIQEMRAKPPKPYVSNERITPGVRVPEWAVPGCPYVLGFARLRTDQGWPNREAVRTAITSTCRPTPRGSARRAFYSPAMPSPVADSLDARIVALSSRQRDKLLQIFVRVKLPQRRGYSLPNQFRIIAYSQMRHGLLDNRVGVTADVRRLKIRPPVLSSKQDAQMCIDMLGRMWWIRHGFAPPHDEDMPLLLDPSEEREDGW